MTVTIVFDIRYSSIIRKSRDFIRIFGRKNFRADFSAALLLARPLRRFRIRLKNVHVLHYNPNYAVIRGYMGYIMHEKDTY